MKSLFPVFPRSLTLLLTFAILIGCNSGKESSSDSKSDNDAKIQSDLSPKEQYVADARNLVDKIFKIVEPVSDQASATKALEECRKLKPKAEKLSQAARKLIEEVKDDQAAREELREFFRSKCHSESELRPLADKLGESEKKSKYPELLKIIIELIETSMHNHF